MGILPNQAAGLATEGLDYAITAGNDSIPGSPDRTQDAITAALKADMQGSPGWLNAHAAGYNGLPPGVPMVLGIIQAILTAAWDGISEGVTDTWLTVEDALQDAVHFFTGQWGKVDSATMAADYANAIIRAGTSPILDKFDRAAGVLGANWDERYVGGLGSIKLDGLGSFYWDGSAGVGTWGYMRYNAVQTATDNQQVSLLMPQAVSPPYFGGTSYMRLCGRVVDTGTIDTFTQARIGYNGVSLGCLVADAETIWPTTSIPVAVDDRDYWDFFLGTAAEPYELTLVRNGVPVISSFVDTAHDSVISAAHRSIGCVLTAADGHFFGGQIQPGTGSVLYADDNTL